MNNEAGDVDMIGFHNALEGIRSKIAKYSFKICSIVIHLAVFSFTPNKTTFLSSHRKIKVRKDLFTFLTSHISSGIETLSLMFIGKTMRWCCFKKDSGHKQRLYRQKDKIFWLTTFLYLPHYSKRMVSHTNARKIFLLIVSYREFENWKKLPYRDNRKIKLLPITTTTILHFRVMKSSR